MNKPTWACSFIKFIFKEAFMEVGKILTNKFVEIVAKHHNPVWAREELEYLVFIVHRDEYEQLSVEDKRDVLDYFDGLTKLHGGR